MIKQKTAIRQLIEILERNEVNELRHSVVPSAFKLRILREVIKKAKPLETVNEQQIVDAVNNTNGDDDNPDLGQDYFTQTFEKP